MKPGFAPAFRQSLAALVGLASSGCSQVATAPHAPLPPTPASSPAPVAIRTPEPIPPAVAKTLAGANVPREKIKVRGLGAENSLFI